MFLDLHLWLGMANIIQQSHAESSSSFSVPFREVTSPQVLPAPQPTAPLFTEPVCSLNHRWVICRE